MGIYDTIMLVVLAAATFIGWRKGMVSQLAAIISVVASFMMATAFHQRVAATIDAPDPWDRIAAFALVYLGTSLIVWIVFRQVRNSVRQLQLGDFDHQLGAFLGAAKGAVIVTVITLVCVNLLSTGPRTAVAESRTGLVVSQVVHTLGPMMPARVQEFLATYVQELDSVLGRPGQPQLPYRAGNDGYAPSSGNWFPGVQPSAPSGFDDYPQDDGRWRYPQNSQYLPPYPSTGGRR